MRWESDPLALAAAPDIDVVVELIGGSERRRARGWSQTALAHGKHVVTANKALLAMHGTELAARGREAGRASSRFEAAVAGGIPIIKALREGLAGNRVARLYGILNGTCNYILTDDARDRPRLRRRAGRGAAAGYAEADPSFDVDGIDAAHKLAVLTGAAFGAKVNFAGVHVEGIRRVSAMDIEFAEELGYRIKLLGPGARDASTASSSACIPAWCRWPRRSPMSRACSTPSWSRATSSAPRCSRAAARAQGPTASAVVADLVDVARGRQMPAFVVPADRLCRQEGLADGPPSGRLLHAPDGAGPAGRDRGGVAAALRRGAHLARIDAPARPVAVRARCRWC